MKENTNTKIRWIHFGINVFTMLVMLIMIIIIEYSSGSKSIIKIFLEFSMIISFSINTLVYIALSIRIAVIANIVAIILIFTTHYNPIVTPAVIFYVFVSNIIIASANLHNTDKH
jgi:hypothetical protein